MSWKKLEQKEIQKHVFEALEANKNYLTQHVLGIPASYLDPKVFSQDDRILTDAPFLSTMVRNPNHIGCHTLSSSEPFFRGTHEIEREAIAFCAEDIMLAEKDSYDGYVASGGTEANIQAMWIYRNYFAQELGFELNEIAILCSEHSHYSMDKGANLLNIPIYKVPCSDEHFNIHLAATEEVVTHALQDGVKAFIVVANMMTTMFGSVDDSSVYTAVLEDEEVPYKLHIDAAFGGFYYPFSNRENELNFANNKVSSITMDAHKMAQAPYGTGIFLIRKGLMKYANTAATYVEGDDFTLIGSRSGANAVSIWMILSKYGPNEWMEKIFILQKRSQWLCDELDKFDIDYFRNPHSNIVTIRANQVSNELAKNYGLVPDNHQNPNWFKIVVMDHVTIERLELFLQDLSKDRINK